MRLPYLILTVFIIVNLLIDWYIYRACRQRQNKRFWSNLHLYLTGALIGLIIVVIAMPFRSGNATVLVTNMWLIFGYMSVYLSKYAFLIIDLIARIPQLFKRKRWKWLSAIAMTAAIAIFVSMWWGALINRFRINTEEVEIEINNLPESFDGYRILQFSDFHVGTYGNDTAFVSEVVDKINEINPDLVTFTGDIVNRESKELYPFIKTLSGIRAKDGVKAILGNHDYGDYKEWESPEDKHSNQLELLSIFNQIGWRMLLNETEIITRDGDSIAIIGVENIGDPPFTVYGNLSEAYPDTSDPVTKILLSHNPSHWNDSIAGYQDQNIALTLSGHTHEMQCSILGWSPSSWRYPTWGGLYEDEQGHKLYVNIGIGTVGFPARVGATPELTVFTLRKANQ